MADDNLKPSEAAMLLLLMAEAREIGNPELRDRYGVEITGESRRKLVDLKLVESRKGLRGAYFYQLSEEGWARCNENVDIGEVRPRAAGHALTAVMAGLRRYLNRKGLRMSHVYAPDTVAEPNAAPAGTTLPDELEAEIRNAYHALADERGDWVSLADLRPRLGNVDKKAVDQVLTAMTEMSRDVNLVPESNQKKLTDAVRESAVRIGGQHKHLISIGAA
jgi:hypothetical protein